MLVSHVDLRVGARRLAAGALLLIPIAGCSGGDLLLPDDRTPALLLAVSGHGQTAPVGAPVRHPLVVEVRDRSNRPVEGAVVVFSFVDPPAGAEIAPHGPETDGNGRAAVEVTLGRPAGDQPVEARLDDPETRLSVLFDLTAIPANTGGPGGGGDGGDDDDDDEGGGPIGGPPPGGGGGNGGGGGGGGGGGEDGDDDDDDDGDDGGNGGGDDDGKGKGKDNGNKGKGKGKGEGDSSGKGNGDDD